jgi:glycosyltransferase involved in cell wall biosynthesis
VRTADFALLPKDRAAALRRRWGVPADATLVGQVARLQPWKGQRDVIAAAEVLLRDRPDLYVVIVGGDVFGDAVAYERALRADVSERGLDGRVVFAGHVTDIVAVLGALDVMVHASPAEPFGTILLEAAAAGVPIVAYDGGGVPELLADEVTALLVPAGDWHALSGGIVRLVDDRRLARALAARAQVTVQRWFDVRPWVRDVQALLLEVAARRGGQVG